MEWWLILVIIFVAFISLMAVGVPVAFAFLAINIVGVYIFWNGTAGLIQLILSIYESVTSFALLPVPLFVLMVEIMFRSGIATKQMEVLDSWLGRIPGRLSLLAVGGGILFATLRKKIWRTMIYVFPMAAIVFLVVGLIFLGIATPTESAAAGTVGCFILAGAYRRLKWPVVIKAVEGTLRVTVIMFMILTGSTALSQILAFTGASTGLVELASSLPMAPILVVIAMQIVLLLLGTFMEPLTIMMLTIPIYFPIIQALGYSSLWFGAVMLLNMEMATTSPPFGLVLFVMKSVAPVDTTMADIYKAALPFLGCDVIAMAAIMAFPALVLWLPGLM